MGAVHYKAVSGPYRKGVMPGGSYGIKVRHAVVGSRLKSSCEDTATGSRWYIPLEPEFGTSRHGFGIHPNGNVPGTLGCIGLNASDAGSFWTRWNSSAMSARPTRVVAE